MTLLAEKWVKVTIMCESNQIRQLFRIWPFCCMEQPKHIHLQTRWHLTLNIIHFKFDSTLNNTIHGHFKYSNNQITTRQTHTYTHRKLFWIILGTLGWNERIIIFSSFSLFIILTYDPAGGYGININYDMIWYTQNIFKYKRLTNTVHGYEWKLFCLWITLRRQNKT